MARNKYFELFREGRANEAHFLLGIDIGNFSAALSYFDINRMAPETLDISGGYGKPTMPTAMQYLSETKEWTYGEYALGIRNSEADINLRDMFSRLGTVHYTEIDGKAVSNRELMTMFVRELVSNCKNINPKAEIAGLTAVVPSYLSEAARRELSDIFSAAGCGESHFKLADDRECIFAGYYHGKEPKDEKVLLLDFGASEMRGGVYSVKTTSLSSRLHIECISSLFSKTLATNLINAALEKYFVTAYCGRMNISEEKLDVLMREQLASFTYQHKDVLFQKSGGNSKLYFNFSYPPFELNLDFRTLDALVNPFRAKLEEFLRAVFTKTSDGTEILPYSIDTVICCGGGFEMLWARSYVKRIFSDANIHFFKNSTTAASEGASLLTAAELGLVRENKIEIADRHRLSYDIGVMVNKGGRQFIPLIERNSFWWQEHDGRAVILADETDGPVKLELFKRDENREPKPLHELLIEGLPKRPAGTTRLLLNLEFLDALSCVASVKDLGFGELFPASAFEMEQVLEIAK